MCRMADVCFLFCTKVNFAYMEHGEKKNTLIKLSMYTPYT